MIMIWVSNRQRTTKGDWLALVHPQNRLRTIAACGRLPE